MPIGGKNPPWGRRNSLHRRSAVTLVTAIFVSGFRAHLLAYGGRAVNIRPFGGINPPASVTGFEPPATSAVVESLAGGAVDSITEGFDMTKHDNAGNLPATLTFQDTELSIIDRDGVPWLTGPDIARALGYSDASKVSKLFNRYKDEFTDAMSLKTKLGLRGQIQPATVRVFSPRGAQLIAMLAKTDRAKAFRRWVLDVLEAQADPAASSATDGAALPDLTALRQQVVGDVVTLIMDKIGPMIAAQSPRKMPPLTKPDDPMPRLVDGHAVFRLGNRMVIVDTNDFDVKRGERAVVIRMEDGEFPKVVTILGDPPVRAELDRCRTFDCGVSWLLPVGAVLGRVVWEGACYE